MAPNGWGGPALGLATWREEVRDAVRAHVSEFVRGECVDRLGDANVGNVGPEPGQAQTLKVLNNFLSATALAASCEALHFGQTQGLDLQKMCDVVNVSTGMNTATLDKIPHQVVTNRFNAGFSNSLLLKDISLYLDGCDEAGITGEISRTVVQLWDNFVTSSPNDDATGIFRYTGKKKQEKL